MNGIAFASTGEPVEERREGTGQAERQGIAGAGCDYGHAERRARLFRVCPSLGPGSQAPAHPQAQCPGQGQHHRQHCHGPRGEQVNPAAAEQFRGGRSAPVPRLGQGDVGDIDYVRPLREQGAGEAYAGQPADLIVEIMGIDADRPAGGQALLGRILLVQQGLAGAFRGGGRTRGLRPQFRQALVQGVDLALGIVGAALGLVLQVR